jgi:hypothetical protein
VLLPHSLRAKTSHHRAFLEQQCCQRVVPDSLNAFYKHLSPRFIVNRIVPDLLTRRWRQQQAQTSLREPRRRFGLARNSERNFENATKSALPSKLHLVRHILHLPIHTTASSFNFLFAPSPPSDISHTHTYTMLSSRLSRTVSTCRHLIVCKTNTDVFSFCRVQPQHGAHLPSRPPWPRSLCEDTLRVVRRR